MSTKIGDNMPNLSFMSNNFILVCDSYYLISYENNRVVMRLAVAKALNLYKLKKSKPALLSKFIIISKN